MKNAHKFQFDTFTGANLLMLHVAALLDLTAPENKTEANNLFVLIKGMMLEMTSRDMPNFWIFNTTEILSAAEIAKMYYDFAIEDKQQNIADHFANIIKTIHNVVSDSPR